MSDHKLPRPVIVWVHSHREEMRDGRKKMAVFEGISPYELALSTDPATWLASIGTYRLFEEEYDLDLQFFLYLLGLLAEALHVPIETELVVKKPDFDLNLKYKFRVVRYQSWEELGTHEGSLVLLPYYDDFVAGWSMEADPGSAKLLFFLEEANISGFALWASPECEPEVLKVLASLRDKCLMLVPSELDSEELYRQWAEGVYDPWIPDLAD